MLLEKKTGTSRQQEPVALCIRKALGRRKKLLDGQGIISVIVETLLPTDIDRGFCRGGLGWLTLFPTRPGGDFFEYMCYFRNYFSNELD